MKSPKWIAMLLTLSLLWSVLSGSLILAADADTSELEAGERQQEQTEAAETTEATQETEASEEPTEVSIPEESRDPANGTEMSTLPVETQPPETTLPDITIPEETQEVTYDPIVLPERFPSVTVISPAPLRAPVTGPQKRQIAKAAGQEADNLVLNKTITDHGDETFTITLESYATGTASVVTKVPIPSDVVLVLDESGSMNDCIDCGHEMSEDCTSLDGDCLHKVFQSDLNTAKKYKTYYKDNTTRVIGYCYSCQKWYTGGPYTACKGHGSLGNWIPFASESDKANYGNNVYVTQFYAACDHDTQRMDALKGAATNFLNKMYASALGADGVSGTRDDVDNRVAIVGYDNDSPARIYTPNQATATGYVAADSAVSATGTLKSILSEKASIMNALSAVRVRSATATNRGMEAANLILTNNPVPAGQQRNRVVILFTDGSPGSNYENNKSWANAAIQHAHTIKQSLGATVYTIGLFWGADASNPANLPPYDASANGVNNIKFFRNGNRFLHLVSSNYPNATSLDKTGALAALGAVGSYYLSADDESGLYSIFGKLSNVVTPGSTTVTLDERTVVKDVVTPYFDIAQSNAITAWTESCNGEQSWTKDMDSISTLSSGPLSVAVSGNTVHVSNFDYAKHYVAADKTAEEQTVYRGKKLVVQISVRPVPGFLGGDDIFTNTAASAIYARAEDAEPVKRFPLPEVDVAVKQVIPQTCDKEIYVSQLSGIPEILNPGQYTLNEESYEADTIRNAYVDIVYTITDPDDNTIACTLPAGGTAEDLIWDLPEGMTLECLLREDTAYRITCQVTSVNNSANKASFTGSASVRVYTPEITFRDSIIDLGQAADYQNNFVNVKWLHNGLPANAVLMGPAPLLEFSYGPAAGAFQSDTGVKVCVTANADPENCIPQAQDITPYTVFYRMSCDFENCTNTETTKVSAADENRVNYVVHIRTFQLRIEKSGADLTLDPNSCFHFRINGPNQFETDVLIPGNGFAVIQNLPVGEYTIRELADWSWRYEPQEDTKTIHGSHAMDGTVTVSFVNVRKQDQWLDGESRAENRFSTDSVQTKGGSGK